MLQHLFGYKIPYTRDKWLSIGQESRAADNPIPKPSVIVSSSIKLTGTRHRKTRYCGNCMECSPIQMHSSIHHDQGIAEPSSPLFRVAHCSERLSPCCGRCYGASTLTFGLIDQARASCHARMRHRQRQRLLLQGRRCQVCRAEP